MIELFATDIRQPIRADLLQTYLSWLSTERKKRLEGYRFSRDRERCLRAAILARLCIARVLGIAPKDPVFMIDDLGCPRLAGGGAVFNLSHGGDHVICAVGPDRGEAGRGVGCDIEPLGPPPEPSLLSLFADEERMSLAARRGTGRRSTGGGSDEATAFYELWVMKESYMKFLGMGFHLPLRDFAIHRNGGGQVFVSSPRWPTDVFFRLYDELPGHRVSICAATPVLPTEICRVDLNDPSSILDPPGSSFRKKE